MHHKHRRRTRRHRAKERMAGQMMKRRRKITGRNTDMNSEEVY
jgi:hypothetical protein